MWCCRLHTPVRSLLWGPAFRPLRGLVSVNLLTKQHLYPRPIMPTCFKMGFSYGRIFAYVSLCGRTGTPACVRNDQSPIKLVKINIKRVFTGDILFVILFFTFSFEYLSFIRNCQFLSYLYIALPDNQVLQIKDINGGVGRKAHIT